MGDFAASPQEKRKKIIEKVEKKIFFLLCLYSLVCGGCFFVVFSAAQVRTVAGGRFSRRIARLFADVRTADCGTRCGLFGVSAQAAWRKWGAKCTAFDVSVLPPTCAKPPNPIAFLFFFFFFFLRQSRKKSPSFLRLRRIFSF